MNHHTINRMILIVWIAMCAGMAVKAAAAHDELTVTVDSVELTTQSAQIVWSSNLPSTGVIDFGVTAGYETGKLECNDVGLQHTARISGIDTTQANHYRIIARDANGRTATTGDRTFVYQASAAATGPSAPVQAAALATGIASDDFYGSTLKPIWTFINPLNDSTLTMTGTQARISVPAGDHELWTNGMNAPRLEQAAPNTDFEIEAKFDSQLNTAYQEYGIFVKESSSRFLRFELYRDGSSLRVFAGSVLNGSATTHINKKISATPQYLRVKRAGRNWTVSYKTNTSAWTKAGSFNYTITVTAAGPHVGGYGPSHTALIDYFFNTSSPISPEDGGGGTNGYSLTVNTTGNGTVTKNPDSATYQAGDVVTLTATPGSGAQFAGWSGDLTGTQNPAQITMNANKSVTATFTSTNNSTFDIWYGDTQQFGQNGNPQVWVDVHGTVTDGDGLGSLAYSLNGGAYKALSIGSDGRRLQSAGDFIVQMAVTDLNAGSNTIVLRALDTFGNVTLKTVTVNYTSGVAPAPNKTIDWATVAKVQDQMQPVDGKWSSSSGFPKNTTIGYDRIICLGDLGWTDYELTVPITVNSWDSAGIGGINGYPGAGFIVGWRGHTNDPPVATQPLSGWNPFGNVVWYSWDNDGGVSTTFETGNLDDWSGQVLQMNTPYIYKVRVERVAGQGTLYSKKVWRQGEPEPGWMRQAYGTTSVETGSIAFIAHFTQITIGNITVTPIGTAPAFSSITVNASNTQATVQWQTSQARSSRIDYGLTTSYELGSVSDATLALSHSMTITGLSEGKLYHYRISGTAADGTSASTGDMTFSTGSGLAIRSDNFNQTSLDTSIWTFVNPVGDATLTMNGSEARIFVPAGSDHDAWTGMNRTGRLMQPCGNTDFAIDAKFNSGLLETYQFHGFVAEQDAANWLRFDVVRMGSTINVFAAQISGSGASVKVNKSISLSTPHYLRVARAGNTYTFDYSSNGTTWTNAVTFSSSLTVNRVGVMVGNAEGSSSPAYTGRIDYFNNSASPSVN